MARILHLTLVVVCGSLLLGAGLAEEKKPQAVKGWGTVVDPDGDCQVAEEKGVVTITVPKTHHDLTHAADATKLNSPRILQEVSGNFRVEVKVKAFPLPEKDTSSSGKYSFVSAGLLIWQDDKNFIRMDRAAEGATGGPFVWVERFADGKAAGQQFRQLTDKDTTLRVERSKDQFTFSVREDEGKEWVEVHTEQAGLPDKLQVGVLAINTTTKEFAPQLSGFKVEQK
jgi:regulation of enolase protein 1 (concanavalin A-like superfamily)